MEEELYFLEVMTPVERQLHYITEEGRQERAKMDRLMAEYRELGSYVGASADIIGLYRKQVREEIKATRERVRWLRAEYRKIVSSSSN